MIGRWSFTIDDSPRADGNHGADVFPFIEAPDGRKLWLATDADVELAKKLVANANDALPLPRWITEK